MGSSTATIACRASGTTTTFKRSAPLQQQRALGRDDFGKRVEARTRQFAGIRPTHRPGIGTYRNK
jgi:hypothetical protein